MKKAVIVVGSHWAGKSKTINKYLKAKLKIGKNTHIFLHNDQRGFILSQSFEESKKDFEKTKERYSLYDYSYLVFAARPENETPSCLVEIETALVNAGYKVRRIKMERDTKDIYYKDKAEEILECLDS